MLCAQRVSLADYLNILNDQVIQSMDFYFPDGMDLSKDDNVKINQAQTVRVVEKA